MHVLTFNMNTISFYFIYKYNIISSNRYEYVNEFDQNNPKA